MSQVESVLDQLKAVGDKRLEWDDLRKMIALSDLDTEMRNHTRAEAHGNAQLKAHYGDAFDLPGDDVGIQYQSPTTVNHNYPAPQEQLTPKQKAPSLVGKAVKTAAMIAAGAAIPIVGPAVINAVWPTPPPAPPVVTPQPTVVPEFTDTDTVIGIGLGKPDG